MQRYLSFIFLSTCLLVSCLTSLGQAAPMYPTGMATQGDGTLIVANKGTRTVDTYSADGEKKLSSVSFAQTPTGVVVLSDGVVAVTTFESGNSRLHRVVAGKIEKSVDAPYGATYPVFAGGRLYVLGQFSAEVAEFDPATLNRLRSTHVLREPKAAAATGKYLFVANFLPAGAADLPYVASDVSVIDLTNFKVIRNIQFANGSNALRDMMLTRDGKYIIVSHNLGRFTVPTTQLTQGWMNTSAISVIDAVTLDYKGAVIVDEPNRGAAGTWAIVEAGDKLVVSHSGTHDVSIIDSKKFFDKLNSYKQGVDVLAYDLRFLYGMRERIALQGNGPRVMSVAKSGNEVYVPTYFSDTLNIVNVDNGSVRAVALNPGRKESLAQVGERVFNDASYCFQNWQSCNGCHPGDARTDGMNWDLVNDGTGNSKNCKSLLFSIQTPPSMISGIRTSAVIANRKGFTHIQFSDIPEEMALAVDAYTMGLQPVPSPYLINGELSPKALAGRKVFEKLNCGDCHSGPYFTDMKMHRIGDDIEFDAGWDTPTLREAWRTAPYLFDGRAATMRDVFAVHKHGIDRKVSNKEIDELTEYVNSL